MGHYTFAYLETSPWSRTEALFVLNKSDTGYYSTLSLQGEFTSDIILKKRSFLGFHLVCGV